MSDRALASPTGPGPAVRFTRRRALALLGPAVIAPLLAACAGAPATPTPPPAAPTTAPATSAPTVAPPATPAPATPTAVPKVAEPTKPAVAASPAPAGVNRVIVLSNSSPQVTVIDAATRKVVRTADLPAVKSWTWNDDNNHYDGKSLWLGTRDPDTNRVSVIGLNLETLAVAHETPLGEDKLSLYLGRATKDGRILVGKMGSSQVAAIDGATKALLTTVDEPSNGDVVCDADVFTPADGVERFYYPSRKGDTVVALDAKTLKPLTIVETPKGATPLMLTVAPDGNVWVQESGSHTNAVFDPGTLKLLKRFPAQKGPILMTFSPDARLAYIGHSVDTGVDVFDARTFERVVQVQVGTNPTMVAVHPNGKEVYAILTKEAALAVIDTATWKVSERIALGTNPSGIFFQR